MMRTRGRKSETRDSIVRDGVERSLPMIRLHRSLRLAPSQHPRARRFPAEPIAPNDEPGATLLGDILGANLDEPAEREALRDWVRRALRPALRASPDHDGRNALFGRPLASAKRLSRITHTRKLNRGARSPR
jgi:hypothetical protein